MNVTVQQTLDGGNIAPAAVPSIRCHRCSRVLTNEKSVQRGYGAVCWTKQAREDTRAAAESEITRTAE